MGFVLRTWQLRGDNARQNIGIALDALDDYIPCSTRLSCFNIDRRRRKEFLCKNQSGSHVRGIQRLPGAASEPLLES